MKKKRTNAAGSDASNKSPVDAYEKFRTMRIYDLIEWLIGDSGSVAGKSTSLNITSNMVYLKGRILENAISEAQRLGAKKMSISIDGDKIRISLPCDADNIAMQHGVLHNQITGVGLYPYCDNVKTVLARSKKSVTVTISTFG